MITHLRVQTGPRAMDGLEPGSQREGVPPQGSFPAFIRVARVRMTVVRDNGFTTRAAESIAKHPASPLPFRVRPTRLSTTPLPRRAP